MEVGSCEARTHLPQLLKRVEKGEFFTITKHGVPVAMLMPVEPAKRKDLRGVIEELKGFNKGQTAGSMTIKKMIEEGRR